MKKQRSIIAVLSLLFLSSCTQRGCQKLDKQMQFSARTYEVTLYSGGKPVFTDKFTGIINGEEGTDGFYYMKGDSLIEISGDYVLRSIDN